MESQLLTAGLNLSLCIYIHLAFLPWGEEEGTKMWQIFVILLNALLEEDQMLCWWVWYKWTFKETEMFTNKHEGTCRVSSDYFSFFTEGLPLSKPSRRAWHLITRHLLCIVLHDLHKVSNTAYHEWRFVSQSE